MPTPRDGQTLAEPTLLLDTNLFWDKYKLPILGGLTLLIVALVASELYQGSRRNAAATAAAKLDAAKSASEYQDVINAYPNSEAAANATLLLGREKMDAKDYGGAAQAWTAFVDRFPQNPLAPAALLGQGSAYEAAGKYDQARAAYQRAATSYPKSYVAPLAQLAEGSLLASQRKLDEARHVFENVVAAYPTTPAASQAQEELSGLKALPPLASSGAAPVSVAPAATVMPPVAPEPTAGAAPTVPTVLPAASTTPAPSATP